jgi:putative sigma-54 modulation protein
MQIQVTGRRMDIQPAIRAYAEEKIGKSARVHDRDEMTIEVVLHVEKNPSRKKRNVAEVTARAKGLTVRAEEAASDMYEAIDLVAEKLETQMRRFKTKLLARRNGKAATQRVKTAPGSSELASTLPGPEEGAVVRHKLVDAESMTEDEAILRLELLGHDFFVFRDVQTADVNVLYRRLDGDYGLIQPRA